MENDQLSNDSPITSMAIFNRKLLDSLRVPAVPAEEFLFPSYLCFGHFQRFDQTAIQYDTIISWTVYIYIYMKHQKFEYNSRQVPTMA